MGRGPHNSTDIPTSQRETAIVPDTKPGDWFRLLRLKPNRSVDSPIHAEIESVCLSDTPLPVYDALSYTYADESGDASRCRAIYIGPYWDTVYVTRNCHEALQSIRSQDTDRLVWVDCLCIDQKCSEEKNHQSSLLHTIYHNASWVIFYIGLKSVDSDLALETLKRAAIEELDCPGKDQDSQIALRSLFQRHCFSRLWPAQETLSARYLEITCGDYSVRWQDRPSMAGLSDTAAPPWFFAQNPATDNAGPELLRLLIDASPYTTSDPRDKVYSVLALSSEKSISPDYSIPVENVYIGVTAHLIKNLHSFEFLSLAGISKIEFITPSWVPDWSRHLVQRFPQALLHSELDVWPEEVGMDFARPLLFNKLAESKVAEIQINADTGSLQIYAIKLCDISGTVSQSTDRSKIAVAVPFGDRGTLVISLMDKSYQVGKDFLFLLDDWNHPVILRKETASESYLFISVCAIYYTCPPSGTWFDPWSNNVTEKSPDVVKIEMLNFEENEQVLDLDWMLSELSVENLFSEEREDANPPVLEEARAKVLDFCLLSLTPLKEIEQGLRNTWNELDQRLGWICLDKIAVVKLLQDINQRLISEHPTAGDSAIKLDEWKESKFKNYCGPNFPSQYSWDLGRFCWSFLHSHVSVLPIPNNTWIPVYPKLREKLTEFQRWAETTEKLLIIFRYSHQALSKSWDRFPGMHLPQKWFSNWENFRSATVPEPSSENLKRRALNMDCFWDWKEFKDCLAQRELIWNEETSHLLNPSECPNFTTHLGLKVLGLDLYSQTKITIV